MVAGAGGRSQTRGDDEKEALVRGFVGLRGTKVRSGDGRVGERLLSCTCRAGTATALVPGLHKHHTIVLACHRRCHYTSRTATFRFLLSEP